MAPVKRGGINAGKAGAQKKAKLDPVSAKLKEVLDVLGRDECDVPGPQSCREGLLAALPHALGLGAASDERHAFQASVANIVGGILSSTEAKRQQVLKEAEGNHEASKAEQASRDAALEDVRGRLSAQHTEIKECKDRLLADTTSEKEATKAQVAAASEVNNFDSIQAAKVSHRDALAAVLQEDFEKLKAGESTSPQDERVQLNKLTSMLTKLDVDKSLVSAIPAALAKKPADRGGFDDTVVAQVDSALKEKLDTLNHELSNGESLKAEKESLLSTAQSVLSAAQDTRVSSQEALKAAEEKLSNLKAEEKRTLASCEEQKSAVADCEIQAFTERVHVQTVQEANKAFTFLLDRVAEAPLPAEPDGMTVDGSEPVATAA